METIKNYLEVMFANMPDTPEVRKAKEELLSMMEDKYNELIENGASENTAIGTVISEFGNLDELIDDLGLTKEEKDLSSNTSSNSGASSYSYNEYQDTNSYQEQTPRRKVSMDEIDKYLSTEVKNAHRIGIGVFLCITSVIYPIIFDVLFKKYEGIGAALMFVSVAIAIALFIISGAAEKEFNYIKTQICEIDLFTVENVKKKKRVYEKTRTLCLSVGVMLCILSVVPSIVFDGKVNIAPASLFVLVGIGVYLLVSSSIIYESYNKVLEINRRNNPSNFYNHETGKQYTSKEAKFIMEVYNQTVVCIYLCISFLTGDWHITWIIFPIAGVVKRILRISFEKEKE
ncbi:MAG: hypothetical protein II013_00025 [Lachnobacterium sp.]|nr:hypothetical protein [Lachnobacterium sp.]